MDNHGSHETEEYIKLANSNHILPYPLLLHSSHLMQHCDIGLFRPGGMFLMILTRHQDGREGFVHYLITSNLLLLKLFSVKFVIGVSFLLLT